MAGVKRGEQARLTYAQKRRRGGGRKGTTELALVGNRQMKILTLHFM